MRIIVAIVFLVISNVCLAQKLYSKTTSINFYSKTAFENIEAKNNKAVTVWDLASGKMEFSVLMKGFEFDRALMQEHFNENYVESDKYPKATFKGEADNKNISLTKDTTYKINVKGDLTIHGVTNSITVPAVIKVVKGNVSSTSTFVVLLDDYKIKVPSIVKDKVNEKVTINVAVSLYQLLTSKQ